MINFKKASLIGAIAASVFVLAACNSDKTTTTTSNPNTSSTSSATDEANAAVVTYSDSGFSPASVNAKVGQKVVFKNTSSSAIQVNSAPHPVHNLYPELNVGMIAAGKEGSTIFTKAGAYMYHNHLNTNQKGTIVVQ